MNEPRWIPYRVAAAIQERQLAEHGGLPGVRDRELIESALARSRNLFAYSPHCTIHQLAAAYMVGIAKNHGFLDANKRAAWVVGAVFLQLNGVQVIVSEQEGTPMMLGVADGSVSEEELAQWLAQPHVTKAQKND